MLPRLSVSKIGPYQRTDAVDAIDLELRNLTYAKVVELGRVPAPAEVAAAAGRDPEEVVAGWRGPHDQHALVLNPATAQIRMANPFSAVPTAYPVCGEPISIAVRGRRPDDESLLFHCLVPAARWWDDIVFT